MSNIKYSKYRTYRQKPIVQVNGVVIFSTTERKSYSYMSPKYLTVAFEYKSIVERRKLIAENKFRGDIITIIPKT